MSDKMGNPSQSSNYLKIQIIKSLTFLGTLGTSFKISLHVTWGVQDRNRSLKVRPPVLEEWVIEEVITDINYSHI